MGMVFPSISFILISQLLLQIPEIDAKVSSIIVFGDSTVDSGNNNYIPTVLKSNFKPYGRDFEGGKATGRFSNGRVSTDFIAEAFGVKKSIPAYLDPAYGIMDFVTGVCFASAGTGFDNDTSKVLSVIPLWKELDYYKEYQQRLREYLGKTKANEVLSETLYIISIGTNDFLENYYLLPYRQSKYSVEEYEDFLAGIASTFITQIYQIGARKISLTGLPPMGCLPLERTTNLVSRGECIDKYNKVAMDFNKKLQELVQTLNRELSGLQLVLTDLYSILYDIIQKPHSFGELDQTFSAQFTLHDHILTKHGFENAAIACCGTGMFEMSYLCNEYNPYTCSDANKYVFWDSFHPTEKTSSIVADYAVRTSLAVFR